MSALALLAREVFSVVLEFIKSMLKTRLGVGILVGSICLGVGFLWGDINGSDRVQARWDAARIAADKRKAELDKEVAAKANKLDQVNADQEVAADRAAQERVDEFRKGLEERGCTFDGPSLERMLRIGK
jgi:hypothetical protein